MIFVALAVLCVGAWLAAHVADSGVGEVCSRWIDRR